MLRALVSAMFVAAATIGCGAWAAADAVAGEQAPARLTVSFNPDWRFIKQDVPGAEAVRFDDAAWQRVSAPHTYNDVDTFDNYSLPGHRGEGEQFGGKTWYRKTFAVPAEWEGKKVYVEFEAVRQFAEVYVNGQRLGVSKNGFVPFGFDLTPHLKFGQANVIAVMCDNRFVVDPYAADGYRPPASGNATAPEGAAKPEGSAKPDAANSTTRPAVGALAQLQHKINEAIPEKLEDLQPDQIPWNNPHWHPAHGGIYRNVKLHVVDPLHVSLPLYSFLQTEGPYVYATDVSEKSAKVTLEVPVENGRADAADVSVVADVIGADGKTVATLKEARANVTAGGKQKLTLSGTVANPKLWEPGSPNLYRVVARLETGGKAVDAVVVPLGIRTFTWDTSKGFFVNGKHVKLHGWGQKPTDEWAGLGAAQPDWMHYFTLDLMRQAGGNFVRWGHCATGPAMIEAGDRLGIVMLQPGLDGEADTVRAAWRLRADSFRDIVIYYRNHPSIAIWEGGNQKVTREHAAELRGVVDKYDPHGGRAYAHRRADKTTAEFMTVGVGTEGGREIKELPVVEGEYNREESPRRVWDDKTPRVAWGATGQQQPVFGYPEAKGMTYQLTSEQFAVNEVGHYVKKLGADNHAGGANWIFSDSTSGGRVPAEVARASGEVDGVRLPKEAYYVCQVMFSDTPQVYVIGHWNYPAGTKKTVYAAGNGDEVELFVNGKSLGRRKPEQNYLYKWEGVTFEPGEVRAVSYFQSKQVAESVKRTAGEPATLRLTPITGPGGWRADGSDVLLVDAEVVDKDGNRCPTFEGRVDFDVAGPAVWRGGYNSGIPGSINHKHLNLEAGVNRVAVRSTLEPGIVRVTAKAANLHEASLEVPSKAVAIETGWTRELPMMPTPDVAPASSIVGRGQVRSLASLAESAAMGGNLITGFSYSGPGKPVAVKPVAESPRAYSDNDGEFASLPAYLKKPGAEYVQLPNADRNYSAVDLMQFTAGADADLYVAYDDRLPAPKWLTNEFKPTGEKITLGGQPATLYKRSVKKDAGVTLGSNTEGTAKGDFYIYVPFVVPAK